jgi:hypothetical protein
MLRTVRFFVVTAGIGILWCCAAVMEALLLTSKELLYSAAAVQHAMVGLCMVVSFPLMRS